MQAPRPVRQQPRPFLQPLRRPPLASQERRTLPEQRGSGDPSMSRRTRVQPLPWDDIHQAHLGQVGWWWDEIPGYEPYTWSEWQDAWAEVTLSVIWSVWRRTGSRMYYVQRDKLLRDDLQS